ncbi:CotY/CotZ family spore coat protein [Peribacillus sp. SCS-155]|uniref:CotY/CotZ family spore coat protein n=1 Tax=Peribacillus sedimenti TaxID=3115297 RepID=UPI00390693D6
MQNSICQVLLDIVAAQEQILSERSVTRGHSKAIQELTGDSYTPPYNTIPIILTYGSTGLPFAAIGAGRSGKDPSSQGSAFLPSAVFRVLDVDAQNSSALLEPLFSKDEGIPSLEYLEKIPALLNKLQHTQLAGNGCSLTVDLECFSAVTCLAPQNVLNINIFALADQKIPKTTITQEQSDGL